MSERRARNEISRNAQLALRAAELLDEGLGDAAVAGKLSAEFKRTLKARTVGSFRKADYKPIAEERLKRRDDAQRVKLVISGAAGAYAQAGQELLAKMLYDFLNSGTNDPRALVGAGKTLAKIREIEIAQTKADIESAKYEAAQRIKAAIGDKKITGAELVRRVDEIMGIKPQHV